MGMLSLLAKLEAVKDFVTTEVPQALEWTSNLLDQVSEGCKEAADFLKNFDSTQVTGEEAKARSGCVHQLDSLESAFLDKAAAGKATMRANSASSCDMTDLVLTTTSCELLAILIQAIRNRLA